MSKFEHVLPRRNHLSRSTASEKIQPFQDAVDYNVTSDVEHTRKKFSLLRFGRSTPSGEDDVFSRSQPGDFHLKPFTIASDKSLQPSLSSACHSACSSSEYSCQSNDSTEQLMLVRTPSFEDQLQSAGARNGTHTKPELSHWEWKMQTPALVRRSLSRSKGQFMSANSIRDSIESVSRPPQLEDEMEELSEAKEPEPPKLKSSKSTSSLRKYFFESTTDSNTKSKGLRKKLSFSQHFSRKRSASTNSVVQPYILDDQTEELSLTQFLTNETRSIKLPGDKELHPKQTVPAHSSLRQKEALHDRSPLPSHQKAKSTSGLFFWRRNKETEQSTKTPTPVKKKLKKLQISSPSAFRHVNQNDSSQYFEPSIRDSFETTYHTRTVIEAMPARSILASSVSSYTSTINTIGTDTTHSRLVQPPPRPPRLRPVMSTPFVG
ncbi:hypothetical protein DFH28DRAFT_268804 [Melampsora americana]|nr:hypothetical protein DFH28DRAFT_268804 [Melampsora americana]